MEYKKRNFFLSEYLGRLLVTLCGLLMVVITIAIIVFIVSKGIQSFTQSHISLFDMLFSKNWSPNNPTNPSFGAVIFIVGSILVSIGAVIIAAPIAISLAVFTNYISPKFGDKILKPVLEVLVGIPSVVYGFLGVTLLIPLIRNTVGGVGFSLFAGIIVLSIMILPTIASIASDAVRAVPKDYLEASYGLGSTRWQAIRLAIVPAAKANILTAIVLGLARAFGEALAVQMVIGNTVKIPKGLFDQTVTLTGILTMDMANTMNGTAWNNALWTLAMILLLISFLFILVIRLIGRGGKRA
jgi:phosphate transport system permease protein